MQSFFKTNLMWGHNIGRAHFLWDTQYIGRMKPVSVISLFLFITGILICVWKDVDRYLACLLNKLKVLRKLCFCHEGGKREFTCHLRNEKCTSAFLIDLDETFLTCRKEDFQVHFHIVVNFCTYSLVFWSYGVFFFFFLSYCTL